MPSALKRQRKNPASHTAFADGNLQKKSSPEFSCFQSSLLLLKLDKRNKYRLLVHTPGNTLSFHFRGMGSVDAWLRSHAPTVKRPTHPESALSFAVHHASASHGHLRHGRPNFPFASTAIGGTLYRCVSTRVASRRNRQKICLAALRLHSDSAWIRRHDYLHADRTAPATRRIVESGRSTARIGSRVRLKRILPGTFRPVTTASSRISVGISHLALGQTKILT